jgi:hypothetical protein
MLLSSNSFASLKDSASRLCPLTPITDHAVSSVVSISAFPLSAFCNGFRLCAGAICVAAAILARLLRRVSFGDQANRLLDPVVGAGLSFLAPEAP